MSHASRVAEFYKNSVLWSLAFADCLKLPEDVVCFDIKGPMGAVFMFRRHRGHDPWFAYGVVDPVTPAKFLPEHIAGENTMIMFEGGDASLLTTSIYPDYDAYNKALGARAPNDKKYNDEEDNPSAPITHLVAGIMSQLPNIARVTDEILDNLQDMFNNLFCRGDSYENADDTTDRTQDYLRQIMREKRDHHSLCVKVLDAAISKVLVRIKRSEALEINRNDRYEDGDTSPAKLKRAKGSAGAEAEAGKD